MVHVFSRSLVIFFSYKAITKAGNDLSLLVILQKILSKDFIIKP